MKHGAVFDVPYGEWNSRAFPPPRRQHTLKYHSIVVRGRPTMGYSFDDEGFSNLLGSTSQDREIQGDYLCFYGQIAY